MARDADRGREIVQQLWPYLDGALPDEWQARVAGHLPSSDACRSNHEFERAFLDAMRSSGALDRDFGPLRRRVVAALRAEGVA